MVVDRIINTSKYFIHILKEKCPLLWAQISVLCMLSGVQLCIVALFTGEIVDALITKETTNFFRFALLMIVIELLANMGINFLTQSINYRCDQQQLELERMLSEKTIRLDYGMINNCNYHERLSRAQQGISWVSGGLKGLINSIVLILRQCVVLITLVYILRELPFQSTLLLLLGILLTTIVAAISQRRDVKFRKRLVSVNRRLSYYLNIFKDVRIAKEVRLFAAQDMLIQHSRDFIEKEWRIERNRTRFGNKIRGLITVVGYATQAMLYLTLGKEVMNGVITMGQFSAFVAAGISFYKSMVSLTAQAVELEKSTSFMNDYYQFMQIKNEDQEVNNEIRNIEFRELRFDHVSFSYSDDKKTMALEDICISIRAGDKIALVGGNGAGKTTLAMLICRFYKPTSGAIYLNGQNISEIPIQDYRKTISAVFQDFQLFPFSIRDNISPNDCMYSDVLSALNRVGLHTKCAELQNGINTFIGKSFDNEGVIFSGGEKQKLAIVRAFLRGGQILLLDEPTAALDPQTEQEIFLQALEMSKNKTLVFISHRMSFCTRADRILLLDQGKIIADGTHKSLLSNEMYYRLWHAQAQYYTNMA